MLLAAVALYFALVLAERFLVEHGYAAARSCR
jgi:hypothetical protein